MTKLMIALGLLCGSTALPNAPSKHSILFKKARPKQKTATAPTTFKLPCVECLASTKKTNTI